MKLMKKIAIFLFAQSVLFFSACRTGVDDSVDLKGPTVTIISPEARENVGEKFEIRCIVTDDFAVGLVTVELDGNTWQHKGSAWQYKPKDGNNFVPYDKAEWIAENKKKVEFCIKDATIEGSGTFTIKVTAIDESGNSSEESTKSRDVIIDKDAPEITLSAPYVAQEPETFTSITNYKDITKITQFLTGDFTISGKTSEENGIQSIEVRITEYGGENELFTKRIVQDKTSENDIVVDSLRSWEIPVRLAECAPLAKLDEKQHILSISTSACDTAGNESGWTRQGYACMWKEADTPWIDIILGTEKSPKYVYSGSSLLGNAYDDTAIKSVNVTIKKKDGNIYGDYDKKQIYSASKDAEDENNVYFELPLPADSDDYSVEITATDNRGNVSETKTGRIKVVDKTFPSIEISHNAESGKLFFDQSGNFTLKITSQDDTKVASVKMAYIHINDLADIVEYSNSGSTKWNEVSSNLNDLTNKKVLAITPKDTGKTITENNFTRKIYENEVKINIFDHLKIDGNTRKLTNQSFVFRVEDADGNALTSTYAIQGDIEAPKIEFTKIEYYSYEGDKAKVITSESEQLPSFGENTLVKVYGKISDNSTDILKDCKKYLALKLTANNIEIAPTVNTDGTFDATAKNLSGASLVFEGTLTDWGGNSTKEKYAFLVDSQTPRVEYISALNPDGFYGIGETINIFIRFNKKLNFTGTTPSLTLNVKNGSTVGKTVYQSKPMANENIGENDILFKYEIVAGDEIDKLDVTGATFGEIRDENDGSATKAIKESIAEIIGNDALGKNLGQMKNINIITTKPYVTNIKFSDKKLTITYNKEVEKGNETVYITQQKSTGKETGKEGVDKVPAVLTETEGKALFGSNQSKLEDYYELTTNGADNKFNANLTSKYVLKYEYNSDGTKDNDDKATNLITEYEKTKAHILSKHVLTQGVEISKDNKTITVNFGSELPCKGAKYKVKIPEGFVQDKYAGSKFKSEGNEDTATKKTGIEKENLLYITADGIEPPVIRINRTATTVEMSNPDDYCVAKQPLETYFKVDCETPDTVSYYKFNEYKREKFTVIGHGTDITPTIEPSTRNKDNKGNPTVKSVRDFKNYTGAVPIGSTIYQEGLEYNITARAAKNENPNSFSEEAYAVAYRTTIEITNVTLPDGKTPGDSRAKPDNQDKWNYPYSPNTPINNNNKHCSLFIRGGDVLVGSNITQGLPTDWDINHADKVCLMTKEVTEKNNDIKGDNYYFTTWAIPKDYYFGFIAGLMDEATANNQGPYCGISPQNSWVSYNRYFPVPPGGYAQINNRLNVYENGRTQGYEWGSFIFELETEGKVIKYRESTLF